MISVQRELSVSGSIADLPRILDFVEEACDCAGIDPDAKFDLQLVVDEACTNIFEHAYDGDGGELSIRFETRGRDVEITLQDRGRPFDPALIPQPDMSVPLEKRPIGGLGLHLIRTLTDDVAYTCSQAGNRFKMVRRNILPRRVPADPSNSDVPKPGEFDGSIPAGQS